MVGCKFACLQQAQCRAVKAPPQIAAALAAAPRVRSSLARGDL
jgi:hypothetical protein